MALKDTIKQLRDLLAHTSADLEKAENGNKAASQRVRTGTVKLEKVAKLYRKESIQSEKKGIKKPAHKKAPAKPKKIAKAKTAKAYARPRPLTLKRSTAKLPQRSWIA